MPKNIVLLSDGTGNSASSPFKTNVWRIYQAIDIQAPPSGSADLEQLVYYDNGVGTENFKPLAALGGAFGVGVWQNVQDLYTYVCRNYRNGDHIYGFGFSRGAFTIRLLMGLIGKCGIVVPNPDSEAALLEAVDMAYEAFRRDFLLRASRERHMIYHWLLREPKYETATAHTGSPVKMIDLRDVPLGPHATIKHQHRPQIPFVGVWDTVDAYGMPVDEMKLAIDRWVWPMSFADRELSGFIQRARHALSLDDERPTFRPVLWNEVPRQGPPLGNDRIQQVWFAGVHANVGGGYPDDGLACTALDWMMRHAQASGLRFIRHQRTEISWRRNPHGEDYDSRAGVAGYYRYGPRDVKSLCCDTLHKVEVPAVLVHVDAFDRIVNHRRGYAPVSLNRKFELTGGDPAQYPPAEMEMNAPDTDRLKLAWDIVWWRRLAYFATLETTAFVALFFAALVWQWPKKILGCTERILSVIPGAHEAAGLVLQKGGSAVSFVLPGWLAAVLPSFSEFPLTAIISLAVLALLFFKISSALQARIASYAEWAWGAQKRLPEEGALEPNWLNTIARPGREVTAFLYKAIWRPLAVHALGIAIGLIALVVLSPIWIVRVFRRRPWMA